MNVATYLEKPAEFRAMQWDTIESAPTMARVLQDFGFKDVRLIDPLDGVDYPYIEFEGHKVFLEQWVVVHPDGSSEVLRDPVFKNKYMEKSVTVTHNIYNTVVRETAGGSSEHHVPVAFDPLDDDTDTGSFMAGVWVPRYFQAVGSKSEFFVGRDDGTIKPIDKSDIPSGHMAYPISWDQARKLGGVPIAEREIETEVPYTPDYPGYQALRDPVLQEEQNEALQKITQLTAVYGEQALAAVRKFAIEFVLKMQNRDDVTLMDVKSEYPKINVGGANPEGWIFETSKYNEETLFKVRRSLLFKDQFDEATADDIINILSNAGILFRERV